MTLPDELAARRLEHLDGLLTVDIDGELLVHDLRNGGLHHLDGVGALIWPFLDGSATTAELVSDLADAFGAPTEVVEHDIAELVKRLDWSSLLVDSPARGSQHDHDHDHEGRDGDDHDGRHVHDAAGEPARPVYLKDPPAP